MEFYCVSTLGLNGCCCGCIVPGNQGKMLSWKNCFDVHACSLESFWNRQNRNTFLFSKKKKNEIHKTEKKEEKKKGKN